MIRWLWQRSACVARASPKLPAGQRAYAIGDVHGRLDLLNRVLRGIEADNAARPAARTLVVMLGDLIDRGPQSAEVVEYLRSMRPDFARFRFVMGNHEEAMLDALDTHEGNPHLDEWLKFGGTATLASYGLAPAVLKGPMPALADAARERVPKVHLHFLSEFENYVSLGDYVFVHAGIRPGIPLHRQKPSDLRWIRDEFLTDPYPHGAVVVHGHTISAEPEFFANRIGIDTGAYRTGVLTALGLEGTERWTIATRRPSLSSNHPEDEPLDSERG